MYINKTFIILLAFVVYPAVVIVVKEGQLCG